MTLTARAKRFAKRMLRPARAFSLVVKARLSRKQAASTVVGTIDSPSPDEVIAVDRVLVAGWVATDSRARVAVIRIDGGIVGAAAISDDRPDVAGALGRPDLSQSGFHANVDLRPLQISSRRRVTVSAELAGTTTGSFASSAVELEPPEIAPTIGYLAAPVDGQRLNREEVGVYGWAVVAGKPGRVAEIFIDGRHVESVIVGDSRPDAADYLGDEAVTNCGFEISIDLTAPRFDDDLFESTVSLSVLIAPANSGETTLELGPVQIELYSTPPPRVPAYVERPALGERLTRDFHTVHGWASSNDSAIDSIEVDIDGEFAGFARFGLDRLDLAEVSDVPEAVTAGFELLVDFGEIARDQRRVILEVVANLADGEREVVCRQSHELIPIKERFETDVERQRAIGRVEIVRTRLDRLLQHFPDPQREELNLVAITHDLGYGGGQLWLSELLERSGAGREFQCAVVSPKDGPLRRDLERLGIKVHVDGAVPVNDLEAYEGRVGELALWSRAMGHNAALVNTVACFSGADMAARLGIPFVWAIHESWTPKSYWQVVFPPNYLNRDVRARAEWALGQANAVVFEAEATRQQYLGQVAPDRACVIPYGVRTAAVDRFIAQSNRDVVRARLGFKSDDQVILLMGTIEPRKAQSLITAAFARIAERHPSAKLVLVGDMKTRYSEAVQKLADRLGVAGRVESVPVVKDTYSWYLAADVLVCASDIESLPRSVLEAMCFGVPILATKVFGLSELLTDGENGFLFEPRDVGCAADALDRVLGLATEELRRIGEAGRTTALDRHDSIGYATAVTSMLNHALGILP